MFCKLRCKTAGVTFNGRQGKLYNILKAQNSGETPITMLRREKDSDDKYAIAVLVQAGGATAKIGYVPRKYSYWLAGYMDKGRVVRAYHGKCTGGVKGKYNTVGYSFDIIYESQDGKKATTNKTDTQQVRA